MFCRNCSIRYTILPRRFKRILEQHVDRTETAADACRARRFTHRSCDTLRADAPRHVGIANAHRIRLSESRRLGGAVDLRRFFVRCRPSPLTICVEYLFQFLR